MVCPPTHMVVFSGERRGLSLARNGTAPAAVEALELRQRSSFGMRLRKGSAAVVVGMPAVSRRSLPPQGSVERAAVFAGGDFLRRPFCLAIARSRVRCDAAKLGIELLAAAEIICVKASESELPLLGSAGELSDGGEGDVGIVEGNRAWLGIGCGMDWSRAAGPEGWPGERNCNARKARAWIPARWLARRTRCGARKPRRVYAPGFCGDGAGSAGVS